MLPENFILHNFFLQERRVDFFGRCFAAPRKLSRGPQFENHWFSLCETLAYKSDVEEGNNPMLTRLTPVATLLGSNLFFN